MKHKGIVAILVACIMTFTVATCEDEIGMEHLEDNHAKYVSIHKKIKEKKKYYKG